MRKLVNSAVILAITMVIILGVVTQKNVSAAGKEIVGGTVSVEGVNIYDDIDKLYAERNELAVHFEENAKRILEIDRELEQLGVEEISYNDLQQKLSNSQPSAYHKSGDADTNWNIGSTKTVKWTSVRQNVKYSNKDYELQIVRGQSKGSNSELYDSNHAHSTTNSGFKASAKNVLQVVASEVLGSLPAVGGVISKAQTFYDAFKGAISGLQKTTSVGKVGCSYDTSLVAEELYVFVKYKGAEDLGHQLLCYAGNSLEYYTSMTLSDGVMIDGVHHAKVNHNDSSGTVKAPYFNDYKTTACKNFWDDRAGKTIHENYKMLNIQQKMIAGNIKLRIPSSSPNIL